ncbi:MAG: hypothetical protein WCE54_08935 [Ignavibacteriaceae bacterium]
MKSLTKMFFLIVFLSSLYLTGAQTIGVIYTKAEADQKFGPVLNSVGIDTAQFRILLNRSGNYLLFKIDEGNLYILSENREPLFPGGFSVQPGEVYKIVSVSKIQELLYQGQNQQIFFEVRKNVYSLTNGSFTLEEIVDCPPFCN